jgi:DNA-binding transcriptional ArsR family regulator
MPEWSFITNHGAVLLLIAQWRQITARDIAARLGLTERPVRRIIADLEAAGYLHKQRVGRVNQYEVVLDLPLPQPVNREVVVRDLLQVFHLPHERVPQGGQPQKPESPSGKRWLERRAGGRERRPAVERG